MAITTPPSPPPPPQPPPPPGPAGRLPPPRRARASSPITRVLPVIALAVVVVIVLVLVLGSSGRTTYHLLFPEGEQLVRGNTVQVGGVPVGSVTNIELTSSYKARVTIEIDSSLAPLHHGTHAQVRVPSLSSVANRYIALEPGPNNYPVYPAGATLPASATTQGVDLDTVFNTFNPKTLKGLQNFIQGTAEQYEGAGRQLGESAEYFAPALGAINHVFAELVSDQPTLTHFIVQTAKTVDTIGARNQQLADLVENANHTFESIGDEQTQLAGGLKQLPKTLAAGEHTFGELPGTFAALEELVKTARPTTPALTTLLERLRGLVVTATPAVHNFKEAISRPGPNNDLTDLARALPALVSALTSASPSSVTALKESIPITNFFGPYAPDLAGTLRTFGQAASYYDANGHYARVEPVLPDFRLSENNTLVPASSSQQALEGLKTGQLRRCPGAATEPAADHSSPFVDGELLSCDATETP
jgi:phospholipid/cholesterol/gamma-HCH transport system substrate-binding protein